MADQNQDNTPARGPRVPAIDLRIPLPWLLGIAGFVTWAIISMWFALNQLVRDVGDLQITVKTGNTQAQTVTGEIALLRFRVENLESERRLQQAAGRPVEVNPLGRAK